jgi:hypothetical protein
VTGQAEREREQDRTAENAALVRVATGPLVGPVLWRVLSMMLARADWPLDRLDDAQLVCDALSAHAPAYASDGHLTFSVQANECEAAVRVLELADGGAEELVQDAMLPVVGNVLERIAEQVSIEQDEHGASSGLTIALKGPSPRGNEIN